MPEGHSDRWRDLPQRNAEQLCGQDPLRTDRIGIGDHRRTGGAAGAVT
jgi:hypothetical protein